MEMDERLLFRHSRRHMLIVLSRGRRGEGASVRPGFVFRRNETNIQMVFVQKPRLGGKKRNDRRGTEGRGARHSTLWEMPLVHGRRARCAAVSLDFSEGGKDIRNNTGRELSCDVNSAMSDFAQRKVKPLKPPYRNCQISIITTRTFIYHLSMPAQKVVQSLVMARARLLPEEGDSR